MHRAAARWVLVCMLHTNNGMVIIQSCNKTAAHLDEALLVIANCNGTHKENQSGIVQVFCGAHSSRQRTEDTVQAANLSVRAQRSACQAPVTLHSWDGGQHLHQRRLPLSLIDAHGNSARARELMCLISDDSPPVDRPKHVNVFRNHTR